MKPRSALSIAASAVLPVAAGACASTWVVRPWHLRWGASDAEIERVWPGDEVVPQPTLAATRAVTIDAP